MIISDILPPRRERFIRRDSRLGRKLEREDASRVTVGWKSPKIANGRVMTVERRKRKGLRRQRDSQTVRAAARRLLLCALVVVVVPIPFAISGAIRQSRLRRHRTHAPATPLVRCHTSFTDGVRRVMPLKRFLFTSPLPDDTSSCPFLLISLDQQREKRLTNGPTRGIHVISFRLLPPSVLSFIRSLL